MKYVLNTILTTILSLVFVVIYLNKSQSPIYYSILTKNYITNNSNIIKVYVFSYNYDNLYTYNLMDHHLIYGSNSQKVEKSYSKFLTKVSSNNDFLYLYEIGIRTNINEESLYKDCKLKSFYNNKVIILNIGEIGVFNYQTVDNLKYDMLFDDIIKVDTSDYEINSLVLDGTFYDNNILKIDTSIINHNLIINDKNLSYIYSFDTMIYNQKLSGYYKNLTESKIYDKN